MSSGEEKRWERLRSRAINESGRLIDSSEWYKLWIYTCDYFPTREADVSHGLYHVLTVTEFCVHICDGKLILDHLVAGLLHDIGRLEEIRARREGQTIRHALISAKEAKAIFQRLPGISRHLDTEGIIEAISEHSDLNRSDDSRLSSNLKDADRLGTLGHSWDLVERTIYGFREKKLYDPDNPFCEGLKLIPGRCDTVVGEVLCNLEWFLFLRNHEAQRLAVPCVKYIIELLNGLACNLEIEWKPETAILEKLHEIMLRN